MSTLSKNFFDLSSNRKLCYYSSIESKSEDDEFFPIIYFHGFPGSGLEAKFCSDSAYKAKCGIYSFDRPGFGFSDPQIDEGDRMNQFAEDIWEFISSKKWKSFSIIGTSGGWPWCLAFLASYLKKPKENRARLEAAASVAGVHIPAGVDEMMPNNKKLFELGNQIREEESYLPWMMIRGSFSLMYYFTYCPEWMYRKIIDASFGDMPQIDKDRIQENLTVFNEMTHSAMRQGSSACVDELKAICKPRYEFEDEIKKCYVNNPESNDLPKITLFHGDLDVNVPMSHSKYSHEVIFGKLSTLVECSGHGHMSLVVDKSDEYVKAVIPSSNE